MSLNYQSFHPEAYIDRKTRKRLEKYRNVVEKPQEFMFNYASLSVNIYNIDWEQLRGVEYSEQGSIPMFLCAFPPNESCVIKGINYIVEDYFVNNLLSIMSVHLRQSRIVQFSSPELKTAIDSMKNVSGNDMYVDNKIFKELDRPFILVEEYLPSIYFLQMGKKRAEYCFSLDPDLGYRRLREIGEIIAMDVFLNNSERVPVIWDGEGNPNNFAVGVNTVNLTTDTLFEPSQSVIMTHVYAIDSRYYPINKQENLDTYNEYLEKVDSFVRGIVRDLNETLEGKTMGLLVLPTITCVKNFFYKHTRIILNNDQLFQILKGMAATFKEIAEMGVEEIDEIFVKVQNFPENDWKDEWKNGTEKLNIEFLLDVKNTIQNVVEGSIKSFQWAYSMYKIDQTPLFF